MLQIIRVALLAHQHTISGNFTVQPPIPPPITLIYEESYTNLFFAQLKYSIVDAVLIDLSFDLQDHLDLISYVHRVFPRIKVLVLVYPSQTNLIVEAARRGACGYLYLTAHAPAFINDLHLQVQDYLMVDQALAYAILSALGPVVQQLTPTEQVVLRGTANGASFSVVASSLQTNHTMIMRYMSNIVAKLVHLIPLP